MAAPVSVFAPPPPPNLELVADRYDPQPSPWAKDPVGWIMGEHGVFLWSKQREILESVRDNRYTAVMACHDSSKSHTAAHAIAWWDGVHPVGEAMAVSTAPTAHQVKSILWREIKRAHRKLGLPGRITESDVPEWSIDGELVAFGRKPADYVDDEQAMSAFQGIHARYVLVVLDEAGGIPDWLWNAVDTLATNENSRVLAIGNPDNPATNFEKICRPGSGWNVIHISAYDTPAYTGEEVPEYLHELLISKTWVKERIKRWGKKAPIFVSKVLGKFPKVATDSLIHPGWIQDAQAREIKPKVAGRYGADIADQGNDETVIYKNRNGHIRLALTPEGDLCVWQGQNTMETAGQIKRLLQVDKGETSAVIDSIGVGAGVVSRLREQDLPVAGFNAGNKAHNPLRFKNRRSEMWWAVRVLFEEGLVDIDPDDDDLAAQLGSIKWSTDSAGRIVIEEKKETKKRNGGNSPDRADAFMHSCVPWDALPPVEERGTDWGKVARGDHLEIAGDVLVREL